MHVNIVTEEVRMSVGGQCKVYRNVMRLWHLVQTNSRWRGGVQTDKQETYCWVSKQAGRQVGSRQAERQGRFMVSIQ